VTRVAALIGLLLLGACAQTTSPGHEWVWGPSRSHDALVDGAWVRMREVRYLAPSWTEEHVGSDGRSGLVRTEGELRPLLRPVTDEKTALAFLDLVQRVELDGGAAVEAIQRSRPLRYDGTVPENEYPSEAYRPSDAARWGVPDRPEVVVSASAVEVRRVVWRPLRAGETVEPGDDEVFVGARPGVVEWVVDTVGRDGRVGREVLRVLETGRVARRHGPFPLM
jgi:hypothetical protein